ncbi:hypothetical protein KC363_g185 [Hortaea werneckii]|nr:hypothetical protein KC363_g185 [Hortaea werneckii]
MKSVLDSLLRLQAIAQSIYLHEKIPCFANGINALIWSRTMCSPAFYVNVEYCKPFVGVNDSHLRGLCHDSSICPEASL